MALVGGSKDLSSSLFVNPVIAEPLPYQPKYTSVEYVEQLLSTAFTASADASVVTMKNLMAFIEQAEAEIDAHEWGRYTQIDEYIDGQHEFVSFQWYYAGYYAQVFYPRHTNIIRILDCWYNQAGALTQDPNWFQVFEGPGANTNFVTLRKAVQTEQLGQVLLFYSRTPLPGALRVRLTYEYGMNCQPALLREYAGKRASVDVILARAAAENMNVNLEEGPWAGILKELRSRLKELKDEVFPRKVRKVYVL